MSEELTVFQNDDMGVVGNTLIEIHYDKEDPTVSGRDLHEALQVKTAYKDWFPRMCEYGFVEGTDFNSLKNERVQLHRSKYEWYTGRHL